MGILKTEGSIVRAMCEVLVKVKRVMGFMQLFSFRES